MKTVTDEWASKCRRYADALIEPLKAVARKHGYALAVHGTLRRDIDLIAVPWTREAVEPVVLAEAIRTVAERVNTNGYAELHPLERDEHFRTGQRLAKPHGRLGWVFHLGGGPYLDLSVMQPWTDAEEDAELQRVAGEWKGVGPKATR